MVRNQKPTGRAMSMPGGVLVGTAVSVILTLAAVAILAKMIDMEMMEWESVGYGIMLTLIVASSLGAVAACSKIKRQILAVSLWNGLAYLGTLLAATALFFGGQYEGIGVTALLILGSSVAAGLLLLRKREGKRRIGKKVLHR